jgi:hypothetical protein
MLPVMERWFFGSSRYGLCGLAMITFMLSGCATELTFRRREALDYFIGKDQTALVLYLGKPTSVVRQGNSDLLTYDYHDMKWLAGEPGTRNSDDTPAGPAVEDAHCATTFRLVNGRVDAWRLTGNDCRNPPYPALAGADYQALAAAAQVGVDQEASFPHSPYTGRSSVNYGEFQTH